MSTEIEIEGRVRMAFMAGLAGALGALSNHPVASAASPDMGDALDDAVRGFRHGARAMLEALAAGDVDDPYVAQMEKIIVEVMASYHALGTVLSTGWLDWLSRWRDESPRGFELLTKRLRMRTLSRKGIETV